MSEGLGNEEGVAIPRTRRLRVAQSSLASFRYCLFRLVLSGSVYFRRAEDRRVYKEASTASVKRIKHTHFYRNADFPRLRPRIPYLSAPATSRQ
jgi:hypothetical protein